MDEIDKVIAGLTKAQREALPKARLFQVKWLGGLSRFIWGRGANFGYVYAGPLQVTWRMSWLAHSARALHPQLFRQERTDG